MQWGRHAQMHTMGTVRRWKTKRMLLPGIASRSSPTDLGSGA